MSQPHPVVALSPGCSGTARARLDDFMSSSQRAASSVDAMQRLRCHRFSSASERLSHEPPSCPSFAHGDRGMTLPSGRQVFITGMGGGGGGCFDPAGTGSAKFLEKHLHKLGGKDTYLGRPPLLLPVWYLARCAVCNGPLPVSAVGLASRILMPQQAGSREMWKGAGWSWSC